jgi:hypothetical protein
MKKPIICFDGDTGECQMLIPLGTKNEKLARLKIESYMKKYRIIRKKKK